MQQIEERKWQQVDNVANVFLAKFNDRDTRVMRVTCTLKEEIKPKVLQQALYETIKIRPQFQVRLHRGLFWRYLEEISYKPKVVKEDWRICPRLYYQDEPKKPLYKVSYFNNRINLDVFHAIADGSGAMEFLSILVIEYLRRMHPGTLQSVSFHKDESADKLTENSFKENYEKEVDTPALPKDPKPAYHVRSLKLPYEQLQFFEVHMPLSVVKEKSKALGVSISSYIGAVMILGLIKTMPEASRKKPVTISMPVNLRQYYKSSSLRNFFNNVNISHTYEGGETVQSLAGEFQAQLTDALEPEKIKAQMNYYQALQRQWAVRAVPLLLKEPGLGFLVGKNEVRVSAVLSNIGFVKFPDYVSKYIESYCGYCSSENPFVVVCSFKDDLTLGISYPYVDNRSVKNFINILSDEGVPVKLYATEVVK